VSLTSIRSDPIFSSDHTEPAIHTQDEEGRTIVRYPDPQVQGLDEDIQGTQQSLATSENWWGAKWVYDFDEDMPQFAIPGKPEYTGEHLINYNKATGRGKELKGRMQVSATPNATALAGEKPKEAPATQGPVSKAQVSRGQMRKSLEEQLEKLTLELEAMKKLQDEKNMKIA